MLHVLTCYRDRIKREDLQVTMLVTKSWRGILLLYVSFLQVVRASQVDNVQPFHALMLFCLFDCKHETVWCSVPSEQQQLAEL